MLREASRDIARVLERSDLRGNSRPGGRGVRRLSSLARAPTRRHVGPDRSRAGPVVRQLEPGPPSRAAPDHGDWESQLLGPYQTDPRGDSVVHRLWADRTRDDPQQKA